MAGKLELELELLPGDEEVVEGAGEVVEVAVNTEVDLGNVDGCEQTDAREMWNDRDDEELGLRLDKFVDNVSLDEDCLETEVTLKVGIIDVCRLVK